MNISEFKQVKGWMSCWRWHKSVATPLGDFAVELRMDSPSTPPPEGMVRLADELVRFAENNGEQLVDVVFGEYRRAVKDDPEWIKDSDVPLGLTRERIKEFVSCSALVVEPNQYEDGEPYKATIYVPPPWDEEHGMGLEVKRERIVAINESPFELVDGVVEYER